MTPPTRGEPRRHATRRHWFSPGDAAALDGVVSAPVAEHIALHNVSVWDGHGNTLQAGRRVPVRDGLIANVDADSDPLPAERRHPRTPAAAQPPLSSGPPQDGGVSAVTAVPDATGAGRASALRSRPSM